MAGTTEKQSMLLVVDLSVSNLCHSRQCQLVFMASQPLFNWQRSFREWK